MIAPGDIGIRPRRARRCGGAPALTSARITLDAYRPHVLLAPRTSAPRQRKRNESGSAGITLLEVLIAVTLLSVLSLAMMLAMRIGISALAPDQQQADGQSPRRGSAARPRAAVAGTDSGRGPVRRRRPRRTERLP